MIETQFSLECISFAPIWLLTLRGLLGTHFVKEKTMAYRIFYSQAGGFKSPEMVNSETSVVPILHLTFPPPSPLFAILERTLCIVNVDRMFGNTS